MLLSSIKLVYLRRILLQNKVSLELQRGTELSAWQREVDGEDAPLLDFLGVRGGLGVHAVDALLYRHIHHSVVHGLADGVGLAAHILAPLNGGG